MSTAVVFVGLFFAYALLSRRLSEIPITAPILFTGAGKHGTRFRGYGYGNEPFRSCCSRRGPSTERVPMLERRAGL